MCVRRHALLGAGGSCVCVCTYMNICMCIHTYPQQNIHTTNINMHTKACPTGSRWVVCVWILLRMYVYMHTCIYTTHDNMRLMAWPTANSRHVCMYAHIHRCMYVHACMHTLHNNMQTMRWLALNSCRMCIRVQIYWLAYIYTNMITCINRCTQQIAWKYVHVYGCVYLRTCMQTNKSSAFDGTTEWKEVWCVRMLVHIHLLMYSKMFRGRLMCTRIGMHEYI